MSDLKLEEPSDDEAEFLFVFRAVSCGGGKVKMLGEIDRPRIAEVEIIEAG